MERLSSWRWQEGCDGGGGGSDDGASCGGEYCSDCRPTISMACRRGDTCRDDAASRSRPLCSGDRCGGDRYGGDRCCCGGGEDRLCEDDVCENEDPDDFDDDPHDDDDADDVEGLVVVTTVIGSGSTVSDFRTFDAARTAGDADLFR